MAAPQIPGPLFPPFALVGLFTDSFMTPWNLYRKYGKLVNLSVGKRGAVLAFGSEYNQQVFTHADDFHTIDSETFPVELPANTALRRLWNNGLLQMNGERHDQQRRLMMPALHRRHITHYRELMIAETEKRLAGWRIGQTRDMLSEVRAITSAIAIRVFLGMDPDEEGAALQRILGEWAGMIQSPAYMVLPLNVPGLPMNRLIKRSGEFERALEDLLARKRELLKTTELVDGLSALIQAQDEDGTRLTDNEIMGQIGTFYVAGHETTASTLTWVLFLLAQHPEVCSALAEELKPFGGDAPTPEEAERLPLLEGVINETLRLFPPLPFVTRTARVPFRMGGAEFPAGTNVGLSAFVSHRLPEVFSNPDKFLPERWANLSPTPYEFIPFSAGSRMCLGAVFARAELKTVLPMIIGRYGLTNPPGATVDYHASIFVAPRGGLPMQIGAPNQACGRTEVRGTIRSVVEF
ncbi:MAG: cytochrome P450 [Anaerolineae bacterium]|nr:MAG: cytochrome P450 [Anaerolineae bacterium]